MVGGWSPPDHVRSLRRVRAGPPFSDGEENGMLALCLTLAAAAEIDILQHPTILEMLRVNNFLRRSVGKREHQLSRELTNAAQDHARFMARSSLLSHYANGNPNYRAAKYDYVGSVRENIACGLDTPEGCFYLWHASKAHWAAICSNAQDVGFGVAENSAGRKYWCALYGYPGNQILNYRHVPEKRRRRKR